MSDTKMGLDVADTLCFQLGGIRRRMKWRQFILALGYIHSRRWKRLGSEPTRMGQAPEKVTGVDLFYLRSMDPGTTNIPHLLAQYLFRHAEGRKSRARLSRGHFIGGLAMHFGLVSDNGLRRFGDTWAWVAQGPERQQGAAAGSHEADKAGLETEEGA
ncbi:hypothetical protein Tco_0102075, partial [Tanacetum coccineum]